MLLRGEVIPCDSSGRVAPAWFNYSGYGHSDKESEGGLGKIAMLLFN